MIIRAFDNETVKSWVIEYIDAQEKTVTPAELSCIVSSTFNWNRKTIKNLIQCLVSEGELEYVDAYGRTILIPSFSRPVHISSNVVLKPPEIKYQPHPQEIVINLQKGIAFGRGNHPTTRLCLDALSFVFNSASDDSAKIGRALDIGTGTGVLAIAAALFGAAKVYGCDIDSIAVKEARENVRLNELESMVTISGSLVETGPCDLIIANLRYPTLISLQEKIDALASSPGYIVLSGIKSHELEKILTRYLNSKIHKIWTSTSKHWSALILKKS